MNTEEPKIESPEIPWLLIKPKISGQGTVYKKDGTISKPEPEQKEQEHGSNPNDRST